MMSKNFKLSLIVLFISCSIAKAQQFSMDAERLGMLRNSHDIGLGKWGPYSKKYAGISHIPDMPSGMRFDFFVVPGYYRNKVLVPNVLFESGYFPWQADAGNGQYGYRYELEWKDKVYTDVNYQVINENSVIAEITCVNRTALPQNLAINLMASINFPETWPEKKLIRPAGSVWINAVDYKSLKFAERNPKDNLVTDGLMKGEVRGTAFLDGSALVKKFGQSPGNEVVYAIPEKIKKGYVKIVFKAAKNTLSTFCSNITGKEKIILRGTGELSLLEMPFDAKGAPALTLKCLGGDGAELNGLLFSPYKAQGPVVEENEKREAPKVLAQADKRQIVLKYQSAPGYYGLSWDKSLFKIREIRNDELDVYFRKMVHNHVDSILQGNDKGHFENIFIRPIALAAGSEITLRCLITHGSNIAQVKSTLDSFEVLKKQGNKNHPVHDNFLSSGEPYAFSQKMLRATLLENMVYPIYTQRQYIRHYTPGKWWNSLYTWDSGFIALGLNEIDLSRATECINAYTTPPGSQSAFIHHGSPVPVQIYAFLDLWNKTRSDASARYFYPRLKQYYSFLSGKLGSSTTAELQSGLLKTWDYFYNSGGWDDYPAQAGVHQQKLESSVSPVITTAHCIRFAKILRMMAEKTGHRSDIASYDMDIRRFTGALQQYAWNPRSGYFSYVRHDADGKPLGPFNYADGSDYNMGLDGAYPLIAGVCTPLQETVLLEKIFSSKHMWTPSGLGVVDQSAPYYRKDGYWNGSVWMPHQWFIWKTMFDLGRPELAMQISKTGLEVFKKETDYSYYTFEHYLSETGRGAGWHQFSGLSTPVLSWYNALYKMGTVTTGFEILLEKSSFNKGFDLYHGKLSFDRSTKAHNRSMMVCLNPSYRYQAFFEGKALEVSQPYQGLLYIKLPITNQSGQLLIRPKI